MGLIISSTRGGGGTETVADTSTPDPNATSGGSPADETDIRALARRSIEVLPAGQWPSLYDDFTQQFQARCTLTEFTQAGADNVSSLSDVLPLLEFKELKELKITGDAASGIIVGRYRGRDNSDYDIEAAFAREDGRWKIAPVSASTGCSAFNQLGP